MLLLFPLLFVRRGIPPSLLFPHLSFTVDKMGQSSFMRSVILAIVLTATANACGEYTNCYDCGSYGYPHCGWDSLGGTTGTCRSGNMAGPTSGVAVGNWSYDQGGCPCTSRTNCYDCTSGFCGWDNSTAVGKCVSVSTPPTGVTANNWRTIPYYCTCDMRKDCRQCIDKTGCGWDMTLGTAAATCKHGTSTGPTVGTATSWAYSTCPCKTKKTCGECIYSIATGCGWNTKSTKGAHMCQPGSYYGPDAGGSADGWKYYQCDSNSVGSWSFSAPIWVASSIVLVVFVADCDSCNDPYADDSCGWDAQNQTCTEGTYLGPGNDTSSPPYWFWITYSCCSHDRRCGSCRDL